MTGFSQFDRTGPSKARAFFGGILAGVMIVLSGTSVFAQRDGDVIRVDTELAAFEVSVTDKSGNPVRNLDADGTFAFLRMVSNGRRDFFQPIKKEELAGRCRSCLRWTFRGA